jgi:transcriptional antiterminator Rof (Rho-off)
MSTVEHSQYNHIIERYKKKISEQQEGYRTLTTEEEFKELFKGVILMFINEIQSLYNKVLIKKPELKFSKSSEKISNLHILRSSLESDGKILNIDCVDIILRSYISYFYIQYRDIMSLWDIDQIKTLNENDIKEVVIDTATRENITNETNEYLNIIPEVVLMIRTLCERDILKIIYFLNCLNSIIDIYLLKKSDHLHL